MIFPDSQRLYTLEEDKLIIKYIVKSNRFIEVRGKCLWVDIQDKVLYRMLYSSFTTI